jgi:hypothetical protein
MHHSKLLCTIPSLPKCKVCRQPPITFKVVLLRHAELFIPGDGLCFRQRAAALPCALPERKFSSLHLAPLTQKPCLEKDMIRPCNSMYYVLKILVTIARGSSKPSQLPKRYTSPLNGCGCGSRALQFMHYICHLEKNSLNCLKASG